MTLAPMTDRVRLDDAFPDLVRTKFPVIRKMPARRPKVDAKKGLYIWDSELLKKRIEMDDLYDMADEDLDLIIAETATFKEQKLVDLPKNVWIKHKAACFFYHLATLIDSRKD
jgi:hypothetical protein